MATQIARHHPQSYCEASDCTAHAAFACGACHANLVCSEACADRLWHDEPAHRHAGWCGELQAHREAILALNDVEDDASATDMSIAGKAKRARDDGSADNDRPSKRGRAADPTPESIVTAVQTLRDVHGADAAYWYARTVLDPLLKGGREKVFKALRTEPELRVTLERVLPLGPREVNQLMVPGASRGCTQPLQHFEAPPSEWALDPAVPTSTGGTIVHFGSGAKGYLKVLSNFANAPVRVEAAAIPPPVRAALQRHYPAALAWLEASGTTRFPTSEHVWQVLKMQRRADMTKFTVDGLFSWLPPVKGQWGDRPHPFASSTRASDRAEAFAKGYMAAPPPRRAGEGRVPQLGIVPKMAVNPARAARLGLAMVPHAGATDQIGAYAHPTWPADRDAIFGWIVRLKFAQNAFPREILRCTGRAYLLEFGRGARREVLKGTQSLWNGQFVPMTADTPDGKPRLVLFGANLMGRLLMQTRAALPPADDSPRSEEEEEGDETK